MPRSNKITIRTGTGVPSASAFVTSEPAWDSSAGKLYVKNAAGVMVEVGGGGSSSSIAAYASVASFPTTGSTGTIYLATDTSRLYQWSGSVYVEVGAPGGSVLAHAASHAANGTDALTLISSQISDFATAAAAAAPATTNASLLTSGTLADARLSSNVVLTSDARLSNSRAPTAHAASHASGGSDQLTLTANQISDFATAAAAATTNASLLTSGTLADARLSANVVLTSDARLSNSRAPTAHAASHASGGSDAITPASIGAAASSHTHTASQVTDFATEAAKYGPVTSVNGQTGAVTVAPVTDGNKGDITVSNSGATWLIAAGAVSTADLADSAVTNAKIASVAATKLTGTIDDARLSFAPLHPFLLMGG